ncbi:MAG TPA: hypothetical protein VLU43_04655 [Anaeromyxobacteraceae bacterium]|nr:hypothetical protein [Anaeromyxobacteraceae bacterium]
MRATVLAVGVAALLAGAPATAFDPTGEMTFRPGVGIAIGASFDDELVVGPGVNMARQEDGAWAGDLAGRNVELEVVPGRLNGANVSLALSENNGLTRIEGLFFGQRVRIQMDGKRFRGRVGACSVDLERKAPGIFIGDIGCVRGSGQEFPTVARATLRLSGVAAENAPPMPQFALGLLAILPS